MLNFTQELYFVNFNGRGIQEIEACFSKNIRDITGQLKFVYNHIATIKKDTFKIVSMQSIFLDHNSIRKVEDDAFNNLPDLEQLGLNNNLLRELNPNAFKKLPKLQTLYLSCNDIIFLQ